MSQRLLFAGFISVVGCAAVVAMPDPLTGAAIKATFSGTSIQLDTPFGTSIAVKYTVEGKISGEAGAMAVYLGSATDRGRWWVENDRLCHKWFKWFDAEIQCLRLQRDGQHLFWTRDDGQKGTASIAAHTDGLGESPSALGAPDAHAASPLPDAMAATVPFVPAATPPPTDVPAASNVPPNRPVAPSPKLKTAALLSGDSARATSQPVVAAQPPLRTAFSPPKVKPAAATPAVATPVFRVAGVHAADVLFVRTGPSADAAAIGAIAPNGRGIRIAGACVSDWCPITRLGVSGWVNRAYLVEDAARTAARVR